MVQKQYPINREEQSMDGLKRVGSVETEESYILSSKDSSESKESQTKDLQSKGSMDEKLYLPPLPTEVESVTRRTSNTRQVDLFAEISPSQEESLSKVPQTLPSRLDDFDNSFSTHSHKHDKGLLLDEFDDEAPLLESASASSSLCACMPKSNTKRKGTSKSARGNLQEKAKNVQRKYYNLYNKGHNPLMLEQTREDNGAIDQKQNTISSASETSNEETAYNSSAHSYRTIDSRTNNNSLHSGRWPKIDNSQSNNDSAHLRQIPSSEPLLEEVDASCGSCLPGQSISNKTRLHSHSQIAKTDSGVKRSKQHETPTQPMSVPYYTLQNPKRETLQNSKEALLARRKLWLHDVYLQESKNGQILREEPPPFYVSAHIVTEVPKMASITTMSSSQQSKTSFARNLRLTSPGEYEEFLGDDSDSEERDENEDTYGYSIPYSLREPLDTNLPIDNQLSTLYEEDEGTSMSMSSRGTRTTTQSKTKKLAEYLKRDGETNFDLGGLSREPSYDDNPIDEELLFDFVMLAPSPQFTKKSATLLLQATKGSKNNITVYSQKCGLYGMRIETDKMDERVVSPIPDPAVQQKPSYAEFHPEPKDQKSSSYAEFHPEPVNQKKEQRRAPTPTKEKRAPAAANAELRSGAEGREDTDCNKDSYRSSGGVERNSPLATETSSRCVHGSGQIILPTISQSDISELTEDIYSVATYRKSPPTVPGSGSPSHDGRKSPHDGRRSPYDGRKSPAFEGRRSPRWMCQSRASENDEQAEGLPSDGRQSPPARKSFRSKKKHPWQDETEISSYDFPDSSQTKQYQTLDRDEQQQKKVGRRWPSKKTRAYLQQVQNKRAYRYRNNSSPNMEKQSLAQNDTLAERCIDLTVQRLEI